MTEEQLIEEFYDELQEGGYDSTNEEHQNMAKQVAEYFRQHPDFAKRLKASKLKVKEAKIRENMQVKNNIKFPTTEYPSFELITKEKIAPVDITLSIPDHELEIIYKSSLNLPEFVITKTLTPEEWYNSLSDEDREIADFLKAKDAKTMQSRMKAMLNSRQTLTGKALYRENDGREVTPAYFRLVMYNHLPNDERYINPKFNALNGFILSDIKNMAFPIPYTNIIYDNGRLAWIQGHADRTMLDRPDKYPGNYKNGGMIKQFLKGGQALLKQLLKFVLDLGVISGAKSEQEAMATGALIFEHLRLNQPLQLQALMQVWSEAEKLQEGAGKQALEQTLQNNNTQTGSSQAFYPVNGAPASYGQAYMAKLGAKLIHISELNGKCPEGYEIEKYMTGGCVKCRKGKKLLKMFNKKKRFSKGNTITQTKHKDSAGARESYSDDSRTAFVNILGNDSSFVSFRRNSGNNNNKITHVENNSKTARKNYYDFKKDYEELLKAKKHENGGLVDFLKCGRKTKRYIKGGAPDVQETNTTNNSKTKRTRLLDGNNWAIRDITAKGDTLHLSEVNGIREYDNDAKKRFEELLSKKKLELANKSVPSNRCGNRVKKHLEGGKSYYTPGIGWTTEGENNVAETRYNNGAAVNQYSEHDTPNARSATLRRIRKRNDWDNGVVRNDSVIEAEGRSPEESRKIYYELLSKGGFLLPLLPVEPINPIVQQLHNAYKYLKNLM